MLRLVAIVVAPLLLIGFSGSSADAQRVPCPKVLRQLQRSEVFGGFRGADPGRVAVTLGTSTAWVERCATVYGRRLRDRATDSDRRVALESLWESQEAGEISREELQTKGDVIVNPVPYKDKTRLRAMTLRKEEWEPSQHDDWRPNAGKKWSPYLYDPHRAAPSYVDGLIRD